MRIRAVAEQFVDNLFMRFFASDTQGGDSGGMADVRGCPMPQTKADIPCRTECSSPERIIRSHLFVCPVTLLPMRTTSVLYVLMFLYVAPRVVWPLRLRCRWRSCRGRLCGRHARQTRAGARPAGGAARPPRRVRCHRQPRLPLGLPGLVALLPLLRHPHAGERTCPAG